MGKNDRVPDAWDDEDWEAEADKAAKSEGKLAEQPVLSKAERLAQHAEKNKKLWESAEAPETFHFAAAASGSASLPLTSDFKPAVKVLSRKPAPQLVARRDPVTGQLSQMTLHDEADDEADLARDRPSPEEVRRRQQRELEEKQRKYNEARAKIFGEKPPPARTTTPPQQQSGSDGSGGGGARGGRGRGRGGQRGDRGGRQQQQQQQQQQPSNAQPTAAGSTTTSRELYDPNYVAKPPTVLQKSSTESASNSGRSSPEAPEQAIRAPRGPDSRAGIGFARRGGAKESES